MAKLNSSFMRKFYNSAVPKNYKGNYEHYMWFSKRFQWERYRMNFDVINHHLKNIKFDSVFELGPGSGIWTKSVLHKNPQAKFTLFDISKEMLNQSRINLGERKNIKFVEGDFTKDVKTPSVDLFFSSRVLEYLPDKKIFFKNLDKILKKNSKAVIITKIPHKIRQKIGQILGKKLPVQHRGQVLPEELLEIIEEYNYKEVSIYPAIVFFPFLSKIHFLNRLVWKMFYKFKIKKFMYPFCESYIIIIKK